MKIKNTDKTFYTLVLLIVAMIVLVMAAISVISIDDSNKEDKKIDRAGEVLSYELGKEGLEFKEYQIIIDHKAVDIDTSKIYTMTVEEQYVFPESLTVRRAQPVKLFILSDAKCIFEIEGLGVSNYLRNGELTEISFTPTMKGEYKYHCNSCCNDVERSGVLTVV